MMLLFETERMFVRRFAESDAGDFFRVNGDEQVVRFIRPVKNRMESDAFLADNLRLYRDGSCLGRFAVFEKNGQSFLGIFSLLSLGGEADCHIGFALVPEAWGKGYATELLQAGADYFFRQTGRSVVFAITDTANTESQKVLLKANFIAKGQMAEQGRMLNLFYLNRPGNTSQDNPGE
jgi:RimJ/RimL family protein N-acetyltransferase